MPPTLKLFSHHLLYLLLVTLLSPLAGQTLVYDPEFGEDGSIEMPEGLVIVAFVELEDGKFLTSADGRAFARHLPNGMIDPSFGDNGFGPRIEGVFIRAQNAVLLPDGKIITIGSQELQGVPDPFGVVLRYNSDGSLDTSFGTDGLALAEMFQSEALVIQPDGKLLVGGVSKPQGSQFQVTRLHPDGGLDSSFGNGGIAITDTGATNPDELLRMMFLQPDGKILLVGQRFDNFFDPMPMLVRYNSDGTLDTDFGNGGYITHELGDNRVWVNNTAYLQPDGKILLAGFSRTDPGDPNARGMFIRLNSDGQLDDSFGSGGVLNSDEISAIQDLFPQPDGGFLFRDSVFPDPVLRLWRLTPEGGVDSEFGTEGSVVENQIGFLSRIIQFSDGKFLVGEESDFTKDPPGPGFMHRLVLNTDPPLISEYEEWLQRHFTGDDLNDETIVARDADPDGDKLTNEFEFEANIVPNDSTSIVVAKVETPGGEKLCVGPILSGVPVSVETSGDMNAWEELIRIEPSVIRREKVEVDLPSPSEGRRFYRARPVRVSTPGS